MADEIFLSASVPLIERGNYHETADPFLIQLAVRELVITVIESTRIVWGGHPSITPMIWAICEDLNVEYAKSVVLYQSKFFADRFPEENERFANVIYVDQVADSREMSLLHMRRIMLARDGLKAAVFIGGMDGVENEYVLFQQFHPEALVLPVAAPGGAARQLAERHQRYEAELWDVDFARLFRTRLGMKPDGR
jgi:hypothetical protein